MRCLLGRHSWEEHPAFDMVYVRRCTRCGRVEADVFWSGWKHRPHLDKLTDDQIRARRWRQLVARELNDQLRRRGDPRAVW